MDCIFEITFPPPTEIFEVDNCIKILKKDGHLIDGHASRHASDAAGRGYKVVPERSIFTKINEAFEFTAKTEDLTGHKLDFEPGDSVLLNPLPCQYKENVVFPAANSGGALRDNALIGSGMENTIIEDEGQPLIVLNPSARLEAFTMGASAPELGIRFFGQGGDQALMSKVRISQAGLGIRDRKDIVISDSRFINSQAGAIGIDGAASSSIVIDNVSIDGGRGIYVKDVQPASGTGLVINKVTLQTPAEVGKITNSRVNITDLNANLYVEGLTIEQSTGGISKSNFVKAQNFADSVGLSLLNNGSFTVGPGVAFIGEPRIPVSGEGIYFTNGAALVIAGNSISQYLLGIDGFVSQNAELAKKVLLERNAIKGNSIGVRIAVSGFQPAGSTKSREFGFPNVAGAGSPLVLQNNSIFGNLQFGVRIENRNTDLGGGSFGSTGGNILSANGQLDLTNESGGRISAKNNVWSSADPNEILSRYVTPGAGIDVAPVMPVQSKYFAQFVELSGFTSKATLTNSSRTNGAAALLAFRNSAGVAQNVPLNGSDSVNGLQPGAVAALGAASFATSAATTAVNVGSLTVASGRPLAGTVLFSGPSGVAGVGASELLTQFIAPVERNTAKSVNSGVAITNPNTTTAVGVQLRLRENSTGQIRQATLQLAAGGQAAKFIDELFLGLPNDFVGTLIAAAPTQIAATIIRTSPGQFATLPVTGAGVKKLLFAQFGEVTGVSSTLTFVNPSTDKTANVTVKLYDDNGAPLTVNLGGQDRAGQFNFNVSPQSSVSFSSPGASAAAKVGSVVVDSTENIGGTILFGGAFGLAGVGASQALSNFIAPVEQSATGNVTIGVALMNLGTAEVTVRLTLRDESGTPLSNGTVDVKLKGLGHDAKFIAQHFSNLDLKDFRGTITGEVIGQGQIGATVIRQSGAPLEFATLPVAEIIP